MMMMMRVQVQMNNFLQRQTLYGPPVLFREGHWHYWPPAATWYFGFQGIVYVFEDRVWWLPIMMYFLDLDLDT